MPAHRKSTAEHHANGTYRPDRHAREPVKSPLDPEPPASLDDAQRAAWAELVGIGEGLLAASDRIAVELAARLVAKMRSTEGMKASETAQLSGLLHRLGLTSAGRRAIDRVGAAPAEDDFSEF